MTSPGFDALTPQPQRLGRYEVLLPIASGGMATVYLGRSLGLAGFEREVALKLTHDYLHDGPDFFTSLIDEARLAGRIRHPNVVSVLDVDQTPGGVFIVMEYVEGDSLAGIDRLLKSQRTRLPLEVALRILDDMLTGLHAAHEQTDATGKPLGLVHRDVTPHNVLVGIDGVSRLTDFGIARAHARITKTKTGLIKGKLAYMSPEQARGKRVDRTADIWAAGVVAWEAFSGLRMYEGLNDAALMLKIPRDAPTPLWHVRPNLPRALAEVVAHALTLDPGARYPTAEAFAEALGAAARSAGIAPADARGVKSFIAPLLGPALEARRAEVARLVARGGRTSAPSAPPPPPERTPVERSAQTVMVDPPRRRGPTPELTATASEHYGALPVEESAPAVEPPERVSMPPALLTAPLRSRLWLALALLPLLALGLVWALLRSPESGTIEVQEPEPIVRPAALPATARPPPTPAATPDAAIEEPGVITPSELAVEEEAPPAPVARPRAVRPAATPAPPAPPEPMPLGNPYKQR